jgi:hypothetical protein
MVYIGKEKCYMKSQIEREKMNYSYDIINMRDIACEELIQSNDPSAIALSILCDFKGQDKQTVINTILKRLRELNDDNAFEKYLEIVTLYSTNRGLEKNVKKGVEMLTVDIEKIPFFQDGVKVGIAQGIERGIEKGKLEERFDNAIVMIEKFKLSIDDIVKELNIKKEELLEYMKQTKSK